MVKKNYLHEKIIKFIFECAVVLSCIILAKLTHSKWLEIVDVILLVCLCFTLTINIINVLRHKIRLDEETVKKERTAAEVAIIGLIMLMMLSSLGNTIFDFHLQVTPKLTDIILYSVLALRDGVYIYLSKRKKAGK